MKYYCYCKIGYGKFKPNIMYDYEEFTGFIQVTVYNEIFTFTDKDMFHYLFKPIVSFKSEMRDQKIEDILHEN